MKPKFQFFLGGKDLEMATITQLLHERGVPCSDKSLGWGARASDYADEIEAAGLIGRGETTVVLVELEPDLPSDGGADRGYRIVHVDHHGSRSNGPASILQVCELLGVEPTREHLLVAANDSGYIPAMRAMGASDEEVKRIRAADRAAQGVTREMENAARIALERLFRDGNLRIVHLPHAKCSTVTDRLFETWPDDRENLLVTTPPERPIESGRPEVQLNYFGRGDVCAALKERYAPHRSWGGGKGFGSPDGQGFAGCVVPKTIQDEAVDFVCSLAR